MIVIGAFVFVAGFVWVLLRRRTRARNETARITPLGGRDTGVASPYRTPGRFFGPRRGF